MSNGKQEISPAFREWLDQLDAIARELDPGTCTESLSKQTGEECWFDYFNDGYSAKDALHEDWSYG